MAAPACTAPTGPPPAIAKIKGIRTKWLSLGRDRRNSIAPDLAHLPLKVWMKDLEAAGVNLAEINLEPQRKLARRPGLSPQAFKQTLDAISTPSNDRSAAQREAVSLFENEIAPHWRYTRKQRDDIQLEFLRRLEDLRRKGEIAGTVRFIIHQRLWFRAGPRPNLAYRRGRRVGEFAQDMATFIRRADAECLGRWLAGIRLGEHSNGDMNELLPLIVSLAHAVNAGSGGWLKTHLFVVNGGGFGAEYRGIRHVLEPDGRPFPFFAEIAAETGAFAFGYKFEEFVPRHFAQGIDWHMAAAACGPQRACNPASVADWEQYLGNDLDFNGLAAYLKANRQRYPADAHVVFTGDAADAVASMVGLDADGKLVARPSLVALRNLFSRAGPVATSGKIFMNGYETPENMRGHYRKGGPLDIGRALYFVGNAGEAQLLRQGKRIWDDWPRP
ncbi:MAG TPA: hypothetical protein VM755_15200 [Stellaceae bacterium]|nr:hypothetical protein [Stellaceae bacterium]